MDSIETKAPSRNRTFTWDDSRITAVQARQRPGLEVLRAVQSGELPAPPMGRLMNIRLTEVERGRIVFEVTPEEYHYNPMGVAHGGLAATLLTLDPQRDSVRVRFIDADSEAVLYDAELSQR